MKNVSKHQGILKVIKRLPSSLNGNPRYLLSIDGFTCVTPVDSGYGYSVTNHNDKEVIAYIGTHYGTTTLDSLKGVI
jgi:hypothetical protein